MASCSHKSELFNIRQDRKEVLDENNITLRHFPEKLMAISDTTVVILADGGSIGVYNSRNGALLHSLRINDIRTDSLIVNTFAKMDSNITVIKAGPDTSKSALKPQASFGNICYANSRLYFTIDVPVKYHYKNELEFIKQEDQLIRKNKKLFDLILSGKTFRFNVQQYCTFFVTASPDLKIASVIPVYKKAYTELDKKDLGFEKGFTVAGDRLVTPVYESIITSVSDSATVGDKADLTLFSELRITGDSLLFTKHLLTNQQIDISGQSTEDYFLAPMYYRSTSDDILFSNSFNIYSLRSANPYLKEIRQKGQRIGNFMLHNGTVFFTLQPGDEFHTGSQQQLAGVNVVTGEQVLNASLGVSRATNIDFYNNTVLQIQKDEKNYYLVTYVIEEAK